MGVETLLITMHLDTIGATSCNPAVGGTSKGHIVREIDALGGVMPLITDTSSIQMRTLNSSRGEAVQSSRAQIDRGLYRTSMKSFMENQKHLWLLQDEVTDIDVKAGSVRGVRTLRGLYQSCESLVICPGTFPNGMMFVGNVKFAGGRFGEPASVMLTAAIKRLGFRMMRFKTGTCPRLDGRTMNFKRMIPQTTDKSVKPFSIKYENRRKKFIPCYITYTNRKTERIIRKNLHRSALFSGEITGTSVRYCPSIEDKYKKFPEKRRHQIFLEPDGVRTNEYYPNGLSTSLPFEVQEEYLHSIRGLENVKIMRPGYAIEHDVIDSIQLKHTLEAKDVRGLFFAGQIDGTTGYEEAAGGGLVAGVNAACRNLDIPPLALPRSQSYIGVLIDDLVTKGTNEPYRMLTSRAEYRLKLREGNTYIRLLPYAKKYALLDEKYVRILEKREKDFYKAIDFLEKKSVINAKTKKKSTLKALILSGNSVKELLKLCDFPAFPDKMALEEAAVEARYAGYIERMEREIKKYDSLRGIKIPQGFDFNKVKSLSNEILQKLQFHKPEDLYSASRISGVTPAAIDTLMIYLAGNKGVRS